MYSKHTCAAGAAHHHGIKADWSALRAPAIGADIRIKSLQMFTYREGDSIFVDK